MFVEMLHDEEDQTISPDSESELSDADDADYLPQVQSADDLDYLPQVQSADNLDYVSQGQSGVVGVNPALLDEEDSAMTLKTEDLKMRLRPSLKDWVKMVCTNSCKHRTWPMVAYGAMMQCAGCCHPQCLHKGRSMLVLESHSLANFCSNPNQTHLNKLIKV